MRRILSNRCNEILNGQVYLGYWKVLLKLSIVEHKLDEEGKKVYIYAVQKYKHVYPSNVKFILVLW